MLRAACAPVTRWRVRRRSSWHRSRAVSSPKVKRLSRCNSRCGRRPGIVVAGAWSLGACAVMVGCGSTATFVSHSAPAGRADANSTLLHAPPAVARICGKVQRSIQFTVMCPTEWPPPRAAGEPQLQVLGVGKGSYLVNAFNGIDDRSSHVFHLLFGGQDKPFNGSLSSIKPGLRVTTRNVEIPKTGGGTYLQQRVARYIGTTTVHGQHAWILREPQYPQGGLQGGHEIVLWNEAGHGYLVSVHGEGLDEQSLIATATAFARSTALRRRIGMRERGSLPSRRHRRGS
jgi:hypothetical protein